MNKDKRIIELKNLVEGAEIALQQARQILVNLVGSQEEKMLAEEAKKTGTINAQESGQVIEGVFDGQNMVGPDGKKYSVPANYASKSKLVEGDGLKLTITPDGSFVYKQINLLDRERLTGKLTIDEKTDEYRVLANNKSYKILSASVTYYKGEAGDKVTILVPQGKTSSWAAVENIYKPGEEPPSASEEAKGEERGDEFLTQETNQKQADKKEEGPQDIFEATKKMDVDDVKTVDEAKENISKLNQPEDDDLDESKDSQGLEEL